MSNELLRTRIGNTVTVVLPVLTRGDAVSLVGRDITIMLVDPNERKTPVSFTIGGVSNNIATFVVEGTSQTATGTYRAEVYENYRGTAMAVYDCDIFVLVARTEYENDGNEGVSSETTTLDPINIAWVGRDGYTPYIQDGYWYINGTSTNVKAAGENGDTPYIENGYWYIGGISTGIKVDYTNEEAQRAASEQVRVVAEAARVQAEAARTLAENSRLTEESGRSAAEGVRILAERDRQAAETTRQTQEEIRHDNEEARVEAELGRAASEASRAQVEATRVANETARTTAEATRAANEQTRTAEETDRAAAETARIAAETARETAEDGRTSAEATRVSNEQTRVSNESTRQSNESARQSAETARQAAYVTAENARDAAFAEKEATRDAANQAALDCAESLAALGPKIDRFAGAEGKFAVTENASTPAGRNVLPVYIKQGESFVVKVVADSAKFVGINALYSCDSDGSNRTVIKYDALVNTEYTLTASAEIRYITFFINSTNVIGSCDISIEVYTGEGLKLRGISSTIQGDVDSIKAELPVVHESIGVLENCVFIELNKDDAESVLAGFFLYADGTYTNNSGLVTRCYKVKDIMSIDCEVGHNSNTVCAVGFFSSETIGASSYIKSASIQATHIPNYSTTGTKYTIDKSDIPQNAVMVVISDRLASLDEQHHSITIKKKSSVSSLSKETSSANGKLDNIIGKLADVGIVQGNYPNGIPASSSTVRIRTGRMIVKSELPITVKISEQADLVMYGYNLYSVADDYTSFTGYTPINSYNSNKQKELEITEAFIGNSNGITLVFANADDSATIDANDYKKYVYFKKSTGELDAVSEKVNQIEEDIKGVKEEGNVVYYGRKQTLEITNESHKLNSSMVVSHLHKDYPYTTNNQSIAVWGDKCFCFNDTSSSLGFCVVINISTGNVLYRVANAPTELTSMGDGVSHLNNACFTDQYYAVGDTYPLLLITRGDYANMIDKRGQKMYIARVTENNGVFDISIVKTIVAQHDYLATFNPSFCYDAARRMIWGYSGTQDWRWNTRRNHAYRKFSGTDALFKAFGASYVCVESDSAASTSASITITVGSTTKTISVAQGDVISEVFPYSENQGGTCLIRCSQDNTAYAGFYNVYICDENGDDKQLVDFRCAVFGFKSPSLTDGSTAIIANSEFTTPAYIDSGTFQGGCCVNGKLYLPYTDYVSINGQPVNYSRGVCLVVEPISGYIESIIPLSSNYEPEGCAIYGGELYISHHIGGATDASTEPSFELYKYSFD